MGTRTIVTPEHPVEDYADYLKLPCSDCQRHHSACGGCVSWNLYKSPDSYEYRVER